MCHYFHFDVLMDNVELRFWYYSIRWGPRVARDFSKNNQYSFWKQWILSTQRKHTSYIDRNLFHHFLGSEEFKTDIYVENET